MRTALLTLVIAVCALPALAADKLDIYFIDVEGGQATLFVSPSGQSMLVDAGWPDANSRDAERIAAAAELAGVQRIDYLVVTHYHTDHVGGVPQLAALIPIRNFFDHGSSVETGKEADDLFGAYQRVRTRGNHVVVKAGDEVPITGIDVQVVTAGGQEIETPLRGAGERNGLCAETKLRQPDPSENARSVGLVIQYGKFRMVDLGDLTWNKEYELVCPNNKLGTVDIYLSTHHGMNLSGGPEIVHVLHPLVGIMNNGATKGGSPEAWQAMQSSPGLQDIWQLHYAMAGGKSNNAPQDFIANLHDDSGQAKTNWIKASVERDGTFTVTNSRNQKTKTYRARGD